MTIKGGDITLCVLGTMALHPVEDGSFEFALGGSEHTPHKSGDGTFYVTGKKNMAFLKGPFLGDTDDKVLEYVQSIADLGVPVTLTFKWCGATYTGQVLPVGALTQKSDAYIDLDLEGPKLEQI